MPGLVPGIHVFFDTGEKKETWMAGTSPAMTKGIIANQRDQTGQMTITTTNTPSVKIDWTKPVLWMFAAFLVVLIVLPLSWLAVYSLTDRDRHLTLQNFVKLFTD